MTRSYDNARRAQEAVRTTERILDAAEALLLTQPIAALTLQEVAQQSGVTVQTVLRHMGSRDGLFAAVDTRLGAQIEARRRPVRPGDREAALDALFEHYEQDAPLVLQLLSQEHQDSFARSSVQQGREVHRRWVREHLLADREKVSEACVDAAVAATDIYVWKLLRLDLGRPRARAAEVMRSLLRAALEIP